MNEHLNSYQALTCYLVVRIWSMMEVIVLLMVMGTNIQLSSPMRVLATKTTLDTFKGTTGFAINFLDKRLLFDGVSICLRFSLFECLDFQPLFGNSEFVLYQSGRHGLGVMHRKVTIMFHFDGFDLLAP